MYTRLAGPYDSAADHKTIVDRASPPFTSIKRIGGSTLNRPARRFRIVACEPLTIGSDNNISERIVKEADAEDHNGR